MTQPQKCPYLPGQFERKVFTHLVGENAPALHDLLAQGGFRRSQAIAYRPACESCAACISVRVLAQAFSPTRNMRKVIALNSDLDIFETQPFATSEQYALFRDYVEARHDDGGMADMSVLDYTKMVEDTHTTTMMVEYRSGDQLLGCALTDIMCDGFSMVYSFYDSTQAHRSLGTFMILDHLARTKRQGFNHLYLGYWVEGSPKMDYKARFQPQERLSRQGWQRAYEG